VFEVQASEPVYEGRVIALRRDTVAMPGGGTSVREIVHHPGAVVVVALDDDDRVVLLRQYRHPVGRHLWELPAGLRDVAGEPLVQTARRELMEEAGCRAGDWRTLTDVLTSPGISTERLRIFLARDLAVVPEAERGYVPEHEEAYLTVGWVPLAEAVRLALGGQLHNGVAILGILSAYAAEGEGFAALRHAEDPETL
jgi:ADP-ribose pyrophosphatase